MTDRHLFFFTEQLSTDTVDRIADVVDSYEDEIAELIQENEALDGTLRGAIETLVDTLDRLGAAQVSLAAAGDTAQQRTDTLEKTLRQVREVLTSALYNQPTGISRITVRAVVRMATDVLDGPRVLPEPTADDLVRC